MTAPTTAPGGLGAAFVQIRADVSQFASGLRRGIRRALRQLTWRTLPSVFGPPGITAAQAFSAQFGNRLNRDITRGIGQIITGPLALLGKAFNATTAKAAGLGAALVKILPIIADLGAAGAALAASLPAALFGVIAAAGTLKLAFKGVGDAVSAAFSGDPEKLQEALKGLAPAARAFVLEIKAAKPVFEALQRSVQQQFFIPLRGTIRDLASNVTPILRHELSILARDFGTVARQIIYVVAVSAKTGQLSNILQSARIAVGDIAYALPGLVKAFLNLAEAGGPFIESLATGLGGALTRFSQFIEDATADNGLAGFFENGLEILKAFGQVLGDVFSILKSVFGALTSAEDTFLGSLGAITGALADFFETAEGTDALLVLGDVLHTIAELIGGVVKALLPVVGKLLQAIGGPLARAFERLVPPVLELVNALADALLPVIDALSPVFDTFVTILADVLIGVVQELVIHVGRMAPVFAQVAATLGPQLIPLVEAFGKVLMAWVPLIPQISQMLIDLVPILLDLVPVLVNLLMVATKVWEGQAWLITNVIIPAITWLWKNVWLPGFQAIAAIIAWAWTSVIKPAFEAIAAFVMDKLVPAVLWLWHNVFVPAFEGITAAINVWWTIVKVIFALWFAALDTLVIKPVQRMWEIVRPLFEFLGKLVNDTWTTQIKPPLEAMGRFISENVPKAFQLGARAVGAAWDALRGAAQRPVQFVINTVINKGLIGTFNKIARLLGQNTLGFVDDPFANDTTGPMSTPTSGRTEFASGGTIRGPGGPRDDKVPIWASNGEFVVNARSAALHRPILEAINGWGRYADGGIIDLITSPSKFVKSGISNLIAQVPGAGVMKDLAVGTANKLVDGLINWATEKVKGLFFSGGGSATASGLMSGIAGVLGELRSIFGNVPLISGLRPGSRTLSGSLSYHALGRAIDIAPVHAWAQHLHARYGGVLRELITPWQEFNVHNGRPHTYTGAVWNQHNFAGGNAHIHAALRDGGLVEAFQNIRPFADGGIVTKPTLGLLAESGPEAVVPLGQMGGGLAIQVFIGDRELTDIVDVRVGRQRAAAGRELAFGPRTF